MQRRTVGTHRRTQGFKLPERGTNIGERCRRGLQNKTQGVGHPFVRRHVNVGATNFASANGDQTFGLQNAKGLARCRRTHLVLLNQCIELRNHLHLTGQYLRADAVGNDLGHPRKAQPSLVVVAHCSQWWLDRLFHVSIVRRSTGWHLRYASTTNRTPTSTRVEQKASDFHVRRY